MKSIRTALQLYTVRDYLGTYEEVTDTIKKIKEIGYDAIELGSTGGTTYSEFNDIIKGIGIPVCSAHTNLRAFQEDPQGIMERYKTIGCDYISINMPVEYRFHREGFETFVKEANEAAKVIKQNGMHTYYHNHHFELQKFDDITGLEIIINGTDPELFDFEIDTFWIQAGGGDPAEWIRKVKGRTKIAHFKDLKLDKNMDMVYMEVGKGNMNFKSIVSACKESCIEYYCVEQDEHTGDIFKQIEGSLNHIKTLIAADINF